MVTVELLFNQAFKLRELCFGLASTRSGAHSGESMSLLDKQHKLWSTNPDWWLSSASRTVVLGNYPAYGPVKCDAQECC